MFVCGNCRLSSNPGQKNQGIRLYRQNKTMIKELCLCNNCYQDVSDSHISYRLADGTLTNSLHVWLADTYSAHSLQIFGGTCPMSRPLEVSELQSLASHNY